MVQIQNYYYRDEDHISYALNSPQQYIEYNALTRHEKYRCIWLISNHSPREKPPAPQFDKLAKFVLGKQTPLLPLHHQDQILPRLESYVVDSVVSLTCGPGRKTAHNFKYRLRLQGYGPESDSEHRTDEVPQCRELIVAHRTANGLNNRASHHEPV